MLQILKEVSATYQVCPNCFYVLAHNYCESCMSKKRLQNKICVVATALDAKNIIDKDVYNETFHILQGEIDINKNQTPDTLKIKELFDRINNENVEILIAVNSPLKVEFNANYLIRELQPMSNVAVSRLARGIPFGGVTNYLDKETLKDAIENRRKL